MGRVAGPIKVSWADPGDRYNRRLDPLGCVSLHKRPKVALEVTRGSLPHTGAGGHIAPWGGGAFDHNVYPLAGVVVRFAARGVRPPP